MPALDRDRTVMVLGLVALMLFATQLTGFVKTQFFGSHRHETMADLVIETPHEIVIAPHAPMAPIPPNHLFETQRLIEVEALAAAHARLAEETARLAEESARLAADGNADAAASLEEAVQQMKEKLSVLQEGKVEAERAVAEAMREVELEAVLAPPPPAIRSERIRVGDREFSIVVKS